MTLGLVSAGAAGAAEDLKAWSGAAGRDEFFWMTQVNKATLLTNSRKGLLSREQAARFARAVKEAAQEAEAAGAARPKMYIRYEPLLTKKAGFELSLMHAGRSSQDIHSTFQRAILRDEALGLMQALNKVVKALLDMAEANRGVLVPCYTNGVAAQPSDLAHVLLAHVNAFERDLDRVRAFYARLNECPMGSCVLNGTGWPLDRQAMSSYLGFDRPVENTFDAGQVSGTDVAVESALVLTHPMLQVCQFIAEIMQQYAQPQPWILVSTTYVSSAMPQKRNPGPIIDIRRDAGEVLAKINGVVFRAHNIPTGMYDAKDEKLNRETVGDATDVLNRFSALLGMLRVNRDRALEEINRDWTAFQELADVLMRDYGIPFRIGHSLASRMVTHARSNGLTPRTISVDVLCTLYDEMKKELPEDFGRLPAAFPMEESQFRAVLDPARIVERRAVDGGPQSPSLDKLFKSAGCRYEAGVEATRTYLTSMNNALKRLDEDFEKLIAG